MVVCHHVVYNVADLAAFALALTHHASNRVVVELTAVHPMTWLRPYWRALHGIEQPERPTVDDAIALCLGSERRDELRDVLEATPPPAEREVVTMRWSGVAA